MKLYYIIDIKLTTFNMFDYNKKYHKIYKYPA